MQEGGEEGWQTDRQTDRQTETKRETETERGGGGRAKEICERIRVQRGVGGGEEGGTDRQTDTERTGVAFALVTEVSR